MAAASDWKKAKLVCSTALWHSLQHNGDPLQASTSTSQLVNLVAYHPHDQARTTRAASLAGSCFRIALTFTQP